MIEAAQVLLWIAVAEKKHAVGGRYLCFHACLAHGHKLAGSKQAVHKTHILLATQQYSAASNIAKQAIRYGHAALAPACPLSAIKALEPVSPVKVQP